MPITLHDRVEMEMLCEQNMEARAQVIALCQKDPVFWINYFAWTFDPRLSGYGCWLPFLLFEKQEEFAYWVDDHIENGRSFGVEKSRDMGCTWIILALIVRRWLFEFGFTANVGSMVEDKVYKAEDKDTLFWKMAFLIVNLPKWMIPTGWDRRKHLTWMKLENPQNQAIITGAAPTENFGRSGRSKFMFFDELQGWIEAFGAWESASQTTPCRGAAGTPAGMNFFGKMMNPEPGSPALDKFILDWKDDERKNHWIAYNRRPGTGDFDMQAGALSKEFLTAPTTKELGRGRGWAQDPPRGTKYIYYPWYVYQSLVVFLGDKVSIAQELDRDYKRSVRGRVYSNFEHARRGRYIYDPDLPTFVALDVGADMTAMGWFQYSMHTRRVNMIDYVQAADRMIDWFVPFWTGRVPVTSVDEYTEEEKECIRRHEGWRVDFNYGDPSGKSTNQVVDWSAYDVLESFGIEVVTNDLARSFSTRIQSARKMILSLNVDEVNCKQFIEAMENYRWPDRGENHNSTGEKVAPVHNKYSHGATMYEYFCVNFKDVFDDLKLVDPQAGHTDNVMRNLRALEEGYGRAPGGITGYGEGC